MREDSYRHGMSTCRQDWPGYPRCNPAGGAWYCNSAGIAAAQRNRCGARLSAPVVESMWFDYVRSCSVDPGSRDVFHNV